MRSSKAFGTFELSIEGVLAGRKTALVNFQNNSRRRHSEPGQTASGPNRTHPTQQCNTCCISELNALLFPFAQFHVTMTQLMTTLLASLDFLPIAF